MDLTLYAIRQFGIQSLITRLIVSLMTDRSRHCRGSYLKPEEAWAVVEIWSLCLMLEQDAVPCEWAKLVDNILRARPVECVSVLWSVNILTQQIIDTTRAPVGVIRMFGIAE